MILVADWHLPAHRTAHTDFFLRFVNDVCRGAEHVFVLGDLFEAWVGPRHVARPGHRAALEALSQLAASGTKVTLLRGNRDFLLDRRTVRRFGLALAKDGWRGELMGRRVRLTHGDELTEGDGLHKALRAITGNFPVSTLVKAMPLAASDVLAGAYRWLSDRRHSLRARKLLRPAPQAVRDEFASGTELLVIAHWHEPGVHTNVFGGKTLVMLGECTEREASYAEFTRGGVELKSFPG